MRITELYRHLLGLQPPWRIDRVDVSSEEKRIDVRVSHRSGARFPCPECGLELSVVDHVAARVWRHLDSGAFHTWVHARIPRVGCLWHGVRQVHVPWALPRAHVTTAFERWAITVLQETDVLGATRLLGISWDQAWSIMEHAVVRGRQAKRKRVIARLGVDEKAVAKGHSYFTLVSDLDRGTVEYVAEDRTQQSLAAFYQGLSRRQLAGIQAVAMDMWDPYITATQAHVPEASSKIVFDRYHIMTHMLKAVDAVRKAEHRALSAAGDSPLSGTKYLWLYSEENLPEYHEEWFDVLRILDLKTSRAWAIKESLRHLWDYQRRGWAERHWSRWYAWATRSRLRPVLKAAQTLRRHLPNILTYFEHRVTNAMSEGLNSQIQTIKKTLAASAIASISGWQFSSTAAGLTSTRTGPDPGKSPHEVHRLRTSTIA
jgi:transposase